MKLLTIFASLLVVAASYPTVKTWTLNELSEVIEKSEGDPDMRKYYIDALNTIMYALFTGKNEVTFLIYFFYLKSGFFPKLRHFGI